MRQHKTSTGRRVTVTQTMTVMAALLSLIAIAMVVIPVPKGAIDFRHLGPTDAPTASTVYRETRWEELNPPGWDPMASLRELQRQAEHLADSDSRAVALLKASREVWDNAPANPAMNGKSIRIAGYVVPLDGDNGKRKEFLLVPYFGACIHSPPPPSNQIVQIRLTKFARELHAMDTVWVSGRLTPVRTASSQGVSSYALDADSLERYTPRSTREVTRQEGLR